MPVDPDADSALFLADPIFLDEHHVQLRFPSEEIEVYQVPGE
jgi:hypothetical protein